MKERLYTLICPNCGEIYEHSKKVRVCSVCGNIAVLPLFTDEDCEKLLEGDDGKGKPPKTNLKAEEDTSNRPPEDGGHTF